jgi:hypothetical protein
MLARLSSLPPFLFQFVSISLLPLCSFFSQFQIAYIAVAVLFRGLTHDILNQPFFVLHSLFLITAFLDEIFD